MSIAPNQQWAMDFMHDTLADGQTMRLLTAIDLCTRARVVLQAAKAFTGTDLAALLSRAGRDQGKLPARILVDNGFIEPLAETARRECSSQHEFTGFEGAQRKLDTWREEYNNTRLRRSLANRSLAKYRSGGYCVPARNRLGNSLT